MVEQDVANLPHYAELKIQPIEYMRANFSKEEFRGYLVGSVLKYISRFERKNGVEDLEKAKVFLCWLIESEGKK